jgi:hypothetical protein
LVGTTLEYFNKQVDADLMAAYGYERDGVSPRLGPPAGPPPLAP